MKLRQCKFYGTQRSRADILTEAEWRPTNEPKNLREYSTDMVFPLQVRTAVEPLLSHGWVHVISQYLFWLLR